MNGGALALREGSFVLKAESSLVGYGFLMLFSICYD